MPIKIKSSGGGSVTIDVPVTAVDTTIVMPTANGVSLFTNNSPVLTGNVAVSGANSYININGNNISPYSGMMKNRIINGDFRIDQRFSGNANNCINGSQYVVDRWLISSGRAGNIRSQQNNTNGPGSSATQIATGFPYYFGCNVVTSNTVNSGDYWQFIQAIEGLNITDLGWGTANAAPVTLSFWVYSSIAGTHGGSIRNATVARSYPFAYTINTANTWEQKAITISGDTAGSWYSNNDIGMYLNFSSIGAGSTFTTTNINTWNSGNYGGPSGAVNIVSNANGSFYLTGVQLEKGSQATPFDFRHYGTELNLCQRYYEQSLNTFCMPMWSGYCVNGATYYALASFKVTKRAIPSITLNTTYGLGFANTTGIIGNPDTFGFYEQRTSNSTQNAGFFSSIFTASAELSALN